MLERYFEALRKHRKRLKQPFAACRMHPPLSRAPSLTETARRIGSSRVYAMRSSSAADLCSKCRIISAAFLRMMMHVDCKWPSLMISKVLSLGLKTSRRQPTGWNRSAQRSGTLSLYEHSSAEMKCLKARSHKETLDSTPAAARLKAFPRIVRERTD